MRKLVLASLLFVCSTWSASARAADGGSQSGILDLAETTEDLAPGGEIMDDDGGTGFEKVDAATSPSPGTAPAATTEAPKMPIVQGCSYAPVDDAPIRGLALIALSTGMVLLLSRRRRVV